MSNAALPALTDDTSDREILLTRLINASREAVFNAWTDPDLLPRWWGPNGFTLTTNEIDVRPGGVWKFIMHGPDGMDYKNGIVYDEIVTPSLITYSRTTGPLFHTIATFEQESLQTLMTVRMIFESAELRDRVVEEFHALDGANQTFDRLEKLLAE